MRVMRSAVLASAVGAGLVLSGCGAPEAPEMPAASQSPGSTDAGVDDAAVCHALNDIMTIVDNADLGLADGRMAAQERDGWHMLATRVLDRIPPSEDPVLSQGLADLRATSPPVPAGAKGPAQGIGSPAWHDALASVADTCAAADAEMTVQSFTGG